MGCASTPSRTGEAFARARRARSGAIADDRRGELACGRGRQPLVLTDPRCAHHFVIRCTPQGAHLARRGRVSTNGVCSNGQQDRVGVDSRWARCGRSALDGCASNASAKTKLAPPDCRPIYSVRAALGRSIANAPVLSSAAGIRILRRDRLARGRDRHRQTVRRGAMHRRARAPHQPFSVT